MNKKIIYLASALFCFLSMGLISCEGEDEGGDYVTPNYVAGTWRLKEIGSLNSQNVLNFEPISDNCKDVTYLFSVDMNYAKSYSEMVAAVCTDKSENGTYAITDGNIVLTHQNATDPNPVVKTLDIMVLTNVALQVAYTDPVTNKLVFQKFEKVTLTED